MIERESCGNVVVVRYMCNICKVGELHHLEDFEKDEFGRYKHICSNCGRESYYVKAYPFAEV